MGENELSQQDIDALFNNADAGAEKTGEQSTPGGAAPDATSPVEAAASHGDEAKQVRHASAPSNASVSVLSAPIEKEQVDAQPVRFSPLTASNGPGEVRNIDFLLDVPVTVTVELGRTAMVIREALNLGGGSVVELNKLAGEPVDLLINSKLVARGEVVVVNENFGVKVIDIISPEERLRYLR
jgi:flagellar motor switch protein FliN/FliY